MHRMAIRAQVASWGEKSLGGGMGGRKREILVGGGGCAVQVGDGVALICTPCVLIVY